MRSHQRDYIVLAHDPDTKLFVTVREEVKMEGQRLDVIALGVAP